MLQRFDETPTRSARALQVWLILIGLASERKTITYGQLASRLGFKGAGTLARILGQVMYFCMEEKLPPLTVLVVNQETGLPGDGLIEADLNADREAAFRYDWFAIYPPTVERQESAKARKGASSSLPG